ncbi:MAG TPA: pentapeptide repeat-containing protein, partial [Pirellula sp.]|nr:pentapeptide repeat-containing protein [Pirellula sp.]
NFISLTSDGHFWGASDAWHRCAFESVHLSEVISPMNMFSGCRFKGASLTNYKPYQTLFEDCLFEQSEIAGLKAQQISNSSNRNPALAGRQSTLVFQGCEFRNVRFRGCFFAGVQFDACRFSNVDAQACDFTGIECSQPWWPEQKSNPFMTFLTQTLEMIRQRCGAESKAHSQFEDYLLDYAIGKTTSQDFSACLYSGMIPDAELDKIEDELSKLMRKFPF